MKAAVLTVVGLISFAPQALAADVLSALSQCPYLTNASFVPEPVAMSVAVVGAMGNSAVVEHCHDVADRQLRNDHSLDGQCIGAVQARMEGLDGRVAPGELDQAIADLVVALASIAQQNVGCTCLDTEIAQAIEVTRSYSSDPDQMILLRDISATVGSCDIGVTASLGFAAVLEASPSR